MKTKPNRAARELVSITGHMESRFEWMILIGDFDIVRLPNHMTLLVIPLELLALCTILYHQFSHIRPSMLVDNAFSSRITCAIVCLSVVRIGTFLFSTGQLSCIPTGPEDWKRAFWTVMTDIQAVYRLHEGGIVEKERLSGGHRRQRARQSYCPAHRPRPQYQNLTKSRRHLPALFGLRIRCYWWNRR